LKRGAVRKLEVLEWRREERLFIRVCAEMSAGK